MVMGARERTYSSFGVPASKPIHAMGRTSSQEKDRRQAGASLAALLLVAASLTYVNPVLSVSDTQPYAFLVSCLVVAAAALPPPTKAFYLLLPSVVAAIVLFSVGDRDVESVRGVYGYLSFALVAIAANKLADFIRGSQIVAITYAWFAVCLIQQFVHRAFAHGLMPRVGVSENRGIVGLAVEPSYLAVTAAFLLLLGWYCRVNARASRTQFRLVVWACAAMMLMSLSGMGFLLFAIFAVVAILAIRSLAGKIVYATLLAASLFFLGRLATETEFGGDLRAFALIRRFIDESGGGLFLDASFAARVRDIVVSGIAFIDNGAMPHGFDMWNVVMHRTVAEHWGLLSGIVSSIVGPGQDRIMSAWGAAIFELGIFGIPLIAAYLVLAARAAINSRSPSQRAWVVGSSIIAFMLMLTQVPLAFPLASIYVGLLARTGQKSAPA